MAELGDLLGTLLVSLSKARQMADSEAAIMAEWYRSHPLLEGLAVPRVRVPEMVLDLPILLEASEPGEPNQIADTRVIVAAVEEALASSAKRNGLELSRDVAAAASSRLISAIAELKASSQGAPRFIPREAVARIAETAVVQALSDAREGERIAGDKLRAVVADVRLRVFEVAEVKAGIPPRIRATLMTSEVKERADPSSVTRVKLTLREEGLEWNINVASDGTSKRSLSPE